MVYQFDGFNYHIRLEPGEHLNQAVEQFVLESKIEGGWITGVGTASEATLGFYNLGPKEYKWRTFGHMMEVVSLTGNISFDEKGKLVLHMHGVFADSEYNTVGGHVKDLLVGPTIELFVHRAYKSLHRKYDSKTGVNILSLNT